MLAHGHQTELETCFDFGGYKYAAPDGAPAGRALLPQRLFDLGGGAPPPYRIPAGFKSISPGLAVRAVSREEIFNLAPIGAWPVPAGG